MKAPEHYRPFKIEQAKAGAPYGLAGGAPVTILKWDARYPNRPLLGVYGNNDQAIGWDQFGKGGFGSDNELVMLPLGMCEGKPVFYGDELNNVQGKKFTAKIETALYENCTWPRADPEYPKTRMTNTDYARVLNCGDKFNLLGCENIANAAIIHAIKSGDVFLRSEVARQVELMAGIRIHFYENGGNVIIIEKNGQMFYPGNLIGDAAQEMRDRLEKRMGTINIFDDELLASEVEKFIKEKHRG